MGYRTILAAVAGIALTGCWFIHEGDPPPPPDIQGEWFALHTEGDTELELTVDIDEPVPHFLVGDAGLRVTEPGEVAHASQGYLTGAFHHPFVDMDFKLFVAAGQDPVEARFEGRYGGGGIGGHFVLDNPVGQADTLALILRRR